MKKVLLMAAFAVASLAANAQVYVGGTLGLGFQNKLIDKDGKDATGMTFKIAPEVGYNLNENSAIGIALGFGVTNNLKEAGDDINEVMPKGAPTKMDKSVLNIEITPYYRYKFLKLSNVDLFIDGQVGFGYKKCDEWNATTFSVGVVPGVAVNMNEKISFVAKLGMIGYESYKQKDVDAVSKFGLNVSSLAALQFGMYYNF